MGIVPNMFYFSPQISITKAFDMLHDNVSRDFTYDFINLVREVRTILLHSYPSPVLSAPGTTQCQASIAHWSTKKCLFSNDESSQCLYVGHMDMMIAQWI